MVSAVQLETEVDSILNQEWKIRSGTTVPDDDDVALKGGGVELDATFLYSDLANSTGLATDFAATTAAKIMKSFLYCASRIITSYSGTVTNFDGDRVMAVFVGDSKNTNAGTAALKINYAVKEIIKPKVERKFPSLTRNGYVVSHATGADTGKILAARAGMRGANDLIWIGRAPGLAAKLSSFRESSYRSFVTSSVYNRLAKDAKYGPKGEAMWTLRTGKVNGQSVYRSTWQWKP